jgi:hypothetical protein
MSKIEYRPDLQLMIGATEQSDFVSPRRARAPKQKPSLARQDD